jgi:hypothetical protein
MAERGPTSAKNRQAKRPRTPGLTNQQGQDGPCRRQWRGRPARLPRPLPPRSVLQRGGGRFPSAAVAGTQNGGQLLPSLPSARAVVDRESGRRSSKRVRQSLPSTHFLRPQLTIHPRAHPPGKVICKAAEQLVPARWRGRGTSSQPEEPSSSSSAPAQAGSPVFRPTYLSIEREAAAVSAGVDLFTVRTPRPRRASRETRDLLVAQNGISGADALLRLRLHARSTT